MTTAMMRPRRLNLAAMLAAATAIVISLTDEPAFALLTAGGNGNTTAPADDPGFANVGISSTGGASVTYLGNGWCITANHVTIGRFDGAWSNVTINGTQYQVTQTVSSPFGIADLKMFQINGDPDLPSLSIPATSPATGTQVTMIGNGFGAAAQQYWNVAIPAGWSSPNPGTWTSTSGGGSVTPIPSGDFWSVGVIPGTYQASGFGVDYNHAIRWGQNLVTKTGQTDGATRLFTTTFNDPSYSPDQAAQQFEAQAVSGDSGGGVFYKDPIAGWQLAGIMYGQGVYPGQPSATAVFGNISAIADLSVYQSTILGIQTPMTWTGQSGSTWDTTSTNWASWIATQAAVVASNSGGAYYAATFGDKNPLTGVAVANSAVTIQATGVAPPSVVFNNSTAVSYSFANAAGSTVGITDSASGPTAVIKNGTGSVTFLASNSFSGPVYVNAGRLNLQDSGALGRSFGVTVAPGAALELQNNVSLPSTIPLTLAGAGLAGGAAGTTGALNSVSGNNTWSGPITLGNGPATINSAAAGEALTISGPVSLGANSLTFAGSGNTSVTSVISGTGSVIKTGSGFLSLAAGNTYTGGTMVVGGIISTGSLGNPNGAVTVTATSNGTSALVLGGQGANPSQWASSLSGAVGSGGFAIVSIGANDTFTVNQAINTTFAGSMINSGNFVKSGAGTLEIEGAPIWGNNSSIQISGGTLKFNLTSGNPSVGSGVTASVVSSGATLQLAGTVSALANSTYQVNVTNNSTGGTAGLYITGTNQQVGSITGTGSTAVAAGGSLTATSIVQGALIIGGSAGSPAIVTIQSSGVTAAAEPTSAAFSDSSINTSFISYLAAGDFSVPFDETVSKSNLTALDAFGPPISSALAGSSSAATVPEPSAALLAVVGAAAALTVWTSIKLRRRLCRR